MVVQFREVGDDLEYVDIDEVEVETVIEADKIEDESDEIIYMLVVLVNILDGVDVLLQIVVDEVDELE